MDSQVFAGMALEEESGSHLAGEKSKPVHVDKVTDVFLNDTVNVYRVTFGLSRAFQFYR